MSAEARRRQSDSLQQVRCPYCDRLAARVSLGATVEVKCVRCGGLFVREVDGAPANDTIA